MTVALVKEMETAQERYLNNLKMITTGKSVNEGKEGRAKYLAGMFSENIRRKEKRVIAYVPVEYFAVCTLYQTEFRTNRDMKLLESKFDWNLFGLVTATLDLSAGVLVATDGQMRIKVVSKANPEEFVPVCVILDAPEDYAERIKFEAKLFTDQNKATKMPTANEKLEAEAEQGDKASIDFLSLIEEYHLKRTATSGLLPGDTIRDTTIFKSFISVNGREGGTWLFDIYKDSGFGSHNSGYARAYAKMLMRAYRFYPEFRKETKEFLIEYLRKKDPNTIRTLAKEAGYDASTDMGVALFLEDRYTEHLGIMPKERKSATVA